MGLNILYWTVAELLIGYRSYSWYPYRYLVSIVTARSRMAFGSEASLGDYSNRCHGLMDRWCCLYYAFKGYWGQYPKESKIVRSPTTESNRICLPYRPPLKDTHMSFALHVNDQNVAVRCVFRAQNA